MIRPLGWHALDFFQIWNQKICEGEKKKQRRKRWQSRGCAKLKQQVSNPAQIASHSLHLRLLLLFLLLSFFSPSSLSSFRGDCCGFSPSLCLGWFWILVFFFMFLMALVHVTWLGRIQSPSYTCLGIGNKKTFDFWNFQNVSAIRFATLSLWCDYWWIDK